jgi:CRP/FNR family transcriptional regulator, anaerobic regulatory protein
MLQTAISASQPIGFMPAESAATAPSTKSTVACSSCCLQRVCLPCGLSSRELDQFGHIVTTKRRVARGAALYRDGDAFEYLYAVRSGAFKTVGVSHHGDEKITGFHLAGELLGLEAISAGRYSYSAVALEDSEVCAIPFAALEKLSLTVPALQHQLFRVLSGDISRDQGLMLLLGSMTAEQRLAAFLLSLSRRYQRLGFAADRFILRMTRDEIGNYLGLTLETVSRLLSRFQKEGLIGVHQREIELKNVDKLRDLVGH